MGEESGRQVMEIAPDEFLKDEDYMLQIVMRDWQSAKHAMDMQGSKEVVRRGPRDGR